MLLILLKAIRLPFSTASVLNFLVFWVALKIPFHTPFFFALGGVFFAHLAANLWNDFFDQKADSFSKSNSPFFGGSQVLQKGLLSLKQFLTLCFIMSFLALFCAIALFFILPFSLKFLGILCLGGFLAFFYTAPPFRFAYQGFGEIVIFLAFGPFLFLGLVFLTQSPISLKGFLLSCYLGIMVLQILMVNELPNKKADFKGQKKTWAVKLSTKNFNKLFLLLGVFLAGILFYFPFSGFFKIFLPFFAFILQITLFLIKKDFIRSLFGLFLHFLACGGWFFYFIS